MSGLLLSSRFLGLSPFSSPQHKVFILEQLIVARNFETILTNYFSNFARSSMKLKEKKIGKGKKTDREICIYKGNSQFFTLTVTLKYLNIIRIRVFLNVPNPNPNDYNWSTLYQYRKWLRIKTYGSMRSLTCTIIYK